MANFYIMLKAQIGHWLTFSNLQDFPESELFQIYFMIYFQIFYFQTYYKRIYLKFELIVKTFVQQKKKKKTRNTKSLSWTWITGSSNLEPDLEEGLLI